MFKLSSVLHRTPSNSFMLLQGQGYVAHHSFFLFSLFFFKIYFIIYLFILFYLFLAVLGLSCGAQASLQLWRAGVFLFSSCGTQASGLVGSVVCSMQALQLRRTSSVVVAHGLSCPRHVGSQFPDQRSNPVPCIVRQILYYWTTREVPVYLLNDIKCMLDLISSRDQSFDFKILRSSELESLALTTTTLAMSCKNLFGAKAKNWPLILHVAVLVMPQSSVCCSFHEAMVTGSVC